MKSRMFWLGVRSLLAALIAIVPLSGVAHADEAAVSIGTVQTEDEIMWIEADVNVTDADAVQVKIFRPKRQRGTALFQRCTFPFSGLGKYRCGFDVADGAPALAHEGRWVSKVVIDGKVTARETFSL